jgi:hypothetical protein
MTRIVLKSKVGPDGVLQLSVPVGPDEANREVRVVIESGPPAMSQEEWRQWVEKMAGSIPDPTFRRHEQGDYEVREELP